MSAASETQIQLRDLISSVIAGDVEGVNVAWIDVTTQSGRIAQVREDRKGSVRERLERVIPKRWETLDGGSVEVDRIHVGQAEAGSRLAERLERRVSRELVGKHIVSVCLSGEVEGEVRGDGGGDPECVRLLGLLATA